MPETETRAADSEGAPSRSAHDRCWLLALVCVYVFWAVGAAPVHAQAQTARISGTVVDPVGHVLIGVTLSLEAVEGGISAGVAPVTRVVTSSVSDAGGRFEFVHLPAGTYVVTAEPLGYARGVYPPVPLLEGQSVEIRFPLAPVEMSEVVGVVGSTGAGDPIEQDQVQAAFLRVFQLPTDRFQEALPLLPGVVRDPKGRLSFNGTRPSQSVLLVNGTNATDPVTGQFAFELPLSVVDTVEVHAIPYSAEFGRVSGAVADVRTVAGDDHWDVDFGGLIPDPRFRNGKIMGIDKATPRVKVSGPLRRGKVWLSQAFAYRLVRSQVKAELLGDDEEKVQGFDAFTQIDVRLSDRHSVTGTLSFFPTEVDSLGIDSLHPALASPDMESNGWNVAVADDLATGPRTLWQTRFALRGFDLAIRPKGTGASQFTPDGLRNNYFNEIDRQSLQLELNSARLQSWRLGTQEHVIKVGGQLLATSFDGIDRSGPIEVLGADGRLLKRITFRGEGELEASDVLTSGYVQDHWQVSPRFALDLGVRYDHDSMLGEGHLSPRAAFSLALDAAGRRILKGGWGRFFDQVFLQVDAFDRFQQRVEQDFNGTIDVPAGPAVLFENRVDPGGLEEPTSRVWNVEYDHQLGESLVLRVNYRENRASGRLVVDRVTDDTGSALLLSSAGELTAREFDATLGWTLADRGQLFVSYSKIRTSADLNDFGVIYDTLRDPLVFKNESALQPFEVPNRVLLWGVVTLPKGFTLTPGIEWRDGFPHSVFAEDYTVIGRRNRDQFPRFLTVDVALTKRLKIFGRQVDVGVQVYNLTSHDNPRDVVSNVASPSFGQFRNSVGNTVSLKLGLGL
jgi:hypothetical protein